MRVRSSTLVVALVTIALAALAVGFGASAADAPAATPEGRAAGFALQVRLPGLAAITHAPAISRGGSARAGGGFATQPDPSIASVIASDTSTNVVSDATAARGDATTRAAGITLLGGLVTATSITTQAAAGAVINAEAQSTLQSTVEGLVVAGQPIVAAPNLVVPIAGVGDLVVEEQVNAVRGPQAARTFAIALHLRVRQDYRGIPAGTEILVGYADAGAAVPDPTSVLPLDPNATPDSGAGASDQASAPINSGPYDTELTQDPPGGGFSANPPIDQMRIDQLLDGSYLFPVLGATVNDYSSDWGAPRADTGFHQGIDIFAASGTPILAINDGTVFRVGWNTIGGRRFWFADRYGNLFYFAHLAGFSPLATEGQTVKRGDVLGFVGNSGDAQGTPPHVHFEIHPGGLWAVPPFAYITSWITGLRQPVIPSVEPVPATTVTVTTPAPAAKPKPKPTPQPPIETLPVTTPTATPAPAPAPPATTAPVPPTTTAPPATTDTTSTGGTTTAITGTGTVFGG